MAFFDHVTHWAKIVTWLHMWGTWKSLEDGELDLANLTDYRDVSLMSSFLQSFHFQHPFNNLWAFLRIIPMNTMPDSKQACWCYPCTLCPVLPHKGTVTVQHSIPFPPLCVSCSDAATGPAARTWDVVFRFWAPRPHFCIMHASFPLSNIWKKCKRAISKMHLNMCEETSRSQNFKLLARLEGNAS